VSTLDDSVVSGKPFNIDIIKPVAQQQEKSAAFLRPAQRPLNIAAAKGAVSTNLTTASESILQPTKVIQGGEARQPQPANKRTLSKKGTTIYKDSAESEQQLPIPPKQESLPTAPVHQNLGPRQIKSQPQLKQDPPLLRRTQSKYIGAEPENTTPSDPAYPVADAHILDPANEAYESYIRLEQEQVAQEGVKLVHDAVDRQHRHLPAPPLVSEPEEYWEEEEEELYDDQGYTTAHSYRSRGDNTTGGATTVLFPKVTNKAKKELAAAKEVVESARTAEEIEDELWDTSMVAEYGDEIFAYMRELEVGLGFFIQSFQPLIHWLALTRP
jgi:G2/mitotic-specific cyclin 3/4